MNSGVRRGPSPYTRAVVICCAVLLTLTAVGFARFFVHSAFEEQETAIEQERLDRIAAREEMRREALIPEEGSTLEQVEAVRIGMTADEVKAALDYPYTLGYEMFPFGMKTPNHYWVVHDIPVKDEGYIQAVFIDKILVGFGCVTPADSRLCKQCLDAMVADERDWGKGLPCMIDDACPECGGTEPVPLGSVLSSMQAL